MRKLILLMFVSTACYGAWQCKVVALNGKPYVVEHELVSEAKELAYQECKKHHLWCFQRGCVEVTPKKKKK